MTRTVLSAVLCATMLTGSLPLLARDYDDGYGRGRNRAGEWRRGGYGGPDQVINQVMRDLDVAGRNTRYVDDHERKHFQHAREELYKFQDRFRQGKWDNGKLDKAIEDLSHLANARQLDPRARQLMANNANVLRDLRANRGRYENGSYGGFGGIFGR